MDNILEYPVIPKEIYSRYRREKRIAASDTKSLWEVFNSLVSDCSSGNETVSKLARMIIFDLRYRINHPSVCKENSSAKVLEDRMAFLCDGRTGDSLPKQNPVISTLISTEEIEEIPKEFRADICNAICSNFREKGDVILYNYVFNSSYKLSVKSLMPDNKEVNFGSFSFPDLMKGIFDDARILGERKSTIKLSINGVSKAIGRGSRKQLQNLYDYLIENGLKDAFCRRFEIMFKGVFKEDVLFYIKDYDVFTVYLMTNKEFTDCVINSIKNNMDDKSKFVINRWEGNSVRMDRDSVLANCSRKIQVPFSSLIDSPNIEGVLKDCDSKKAELLMEKVQPSGKHR